MHRNDYMSAGRKDELDWMEDEFNQYQSKTQRIRDKEGEGVGHIIRPHGEDEGRARVGC